MSRIKEYTGQRAIECANCYGEGKHSYSMWLTEEEIIRCKDCANTFLTFDKLLWCNRNHNLDGGCYMVDPDGFCAWAERRES